MCRKIRYLLGSIGLLGIIIVGCNHAESNEQNTISSGYVEENSSEISTSIAEEEDNIRNHYVVGGSVANHLFQLIGPEYESGDIFWVAASEEQITGEYQDTKYTNTYRYYAIDETGKIYCSLLDWVIPQSIFVNGVALVKIEDGPFRLIDLNGDIIDSNSILKEGEEFIRLIKDNDGGTFWIKREIDTYNSNELYVVAKDKDGNEKMTISGEGVNEETIQAAQAGSWVRPVIEYEGNGFYSISNVSIFNMSDKKIHQGYTIQGIGDDGNALLSEKNSDNIIVMDQNSNIIAPERNLSQEIRAGNVSYFFNEGICEAYTSRDYGRGNTYYYDLYQGKVIADLSEYDIQEETEYRGGYAAVEFENSADNSYVGIVDTQGNWAFEPTRGELEANFIKEINACLISNGSEKSYLDINGNIERAAELIQSLSIVTDDWASLEGDEPIGYVKKDRIFAINNGEYNLLNLKGDILEE